jgi:(3S)-malyl-CoA thioesterase
VPTQPDLRPLRSLLYLPASNARALDKARELPCDGIIFDLEDAVAPAEKPAARAALASALAEGGFAPRLRLVRINALDTVWGPDDARAAASMDCDGVLLPKVNGPADLDALAVLVPDRPLWAMMETPAAILNAAAIAAHPRLAGLVLGTNDLIKDLGARVRPDRLALMHSLQTCVLAARAAGVPVIDGVYNAFRDDAGLAAECAQGRDMGMDGKTLIHPAQVAVANAAFAPSAEEVDLARRQIAAFEAAEAAGQGVAVLDGRIVENLHVVAARRILALADAITTHTQGAAA